MIRVASDGVVPVGIDNHCDVWRGGGKGDGDTAIHYVVYGYSNGKGRGSPGTGDGAGRGIPYSSELSSELSVTYRSE